MQNDDLPTSTSNDPKEMLKSRGIDPETVPGLVKDIQHLQQELEQYPATVCDACYTWTATHVALAKNGEPFLVCDKPKCQDAVANYAGTIRK